MTTLVTGATGFVGSHVARQLVNAGQSVRALVRPGSNLEALAGLHLEYFEGDLRHANSLERASCSPLRNVRALSVSSIPAR